MTETKLFRVVLTIIDISFLLISFIVIFCGGGGLILMMAGGALRALFHAIITYVLPRIEHHLFVFALIVVAMLWSMVRWHKINRGSNQKFLSSWR